MSPSPMSLLPSSEPARSPLVERARPLLLVAGVVGAAVAVRLARRDLNAPIDRSGAAVPLDRERAPIGATSDAHLVDRPTDPDWVRDLARWRPAPPRTALGRAVAVAWASPASLVGLLVGLLGGRAPVARDGVLVFERVRGLPRLALERGGFAATTLGHVVIARGTPSPSLMAHELIHTRQAERLGPLTGPLYWSLLARYGYARHPMERAARVAGREAREDASRPPRRRTAA